MNINELGEYEALKAFPIKIVKNLQTELEQDLREIHRGIFKIGFDCAMNLGLTVKFADWILQNNIEQVQTPSEMRYYNNPFTDKFETSQQLFDYWLKNIFKIK